MSILYRYDMAFIICSELIATKNLISYKLKISSTDNLVIEQLQNLRIILSVFHGDNGNDEDKKVVQIFDRPEHICNV